MTQDERIATLGPGSVLIDAKGDTLTPPMGWEFLAAGDAAITRKVTAGGAFLRVQTRMGRRMISKGVWAPAATIASARREVEAQRATGAYQKQLNGDRKRRAVKQKAYEEEFYRAVRAWLAFAPRYEALERAMAKAVTVHAVPVGSGTVARTVMIPLAERAARAVIAWMRHRTTAYESMSIARVKGERRQVRRMLAQRSTQLLQTYREGKEPRCDCPLRTALEPTRMPATGG
jgi:hypothetical protein